MKIAQTLLDLAIKAKDASRRFSLASQEEKNRALFLIAESLEQSQKTILAANQQDLEAGRSHLSASLLDRLSLEGRLEGMIHDVRRVADLPDPVGEIIEAQTLPNGLLLHKKRVPIGVLGVIYEARPNVTVDTAALVLKTGNTAILRGGKEAIRTNQALMKAIKAGLAKSTLPQEALQLIKTASRSQVKQLLQLDAYVDMIIPRGGEGLQQFCRQHSTIPVIFGGAGICHLFVDASADLAKATRVILNAKMQRPAACNALDTLLVHHAIAPLFLPTLLSQLAEKGVCLHLDAKAWALFAHAGIPGCQQAEPTDWKTEWLSLVLNIKIVESIEEAIAHTQKYGGHSDGILTNTPAHARLFATAVDSAAVYINASTRFTDGGQFGLGAEIAVSTQKLHARGPVALKELTTYKWIIEGDYHERLS